MGSLFGGGTQKQTTKIELDPAQKELISLATPYLKQFASSPPTAPNQSYIAGFNPTQQTAQQMMLGTALGQAPIAGQAGQANQFLLGDVLNPGSNPYLQQYMDAAIRPITENFTENVLPNLRNQSIGQGNAGLTNYSSTRGSMQENQASSDYLRQVGETTANIGNAAYGQGLDAMTKALGLTPQTLNAMQIPAQGVSAVGDIRQALEQALLSEQSQQDYMAQYMPLLIGQEILGASGMIPSAGTTSTGNAPKNNPLSTGLGMTSLLSGMGMSNPVSLGVGGGAALLNMLFS